MRYIAKSQIAMPHVKKFGDFVNENHTDLKNYMFFQNLHTIKHAIDSLLFMDSYEIDEILENGHDWANDHISAAKESIVQVADFFKMEKEETGTSDMPEDMPEEENIPAE